MPKCTKTYFQPRWMEEEDFKSWIAEDPKGKDSAFCRICKKSFSLSSMGRQALRSHARGKFHMDASARHRGTPSINSLFGVKSDPTKKTEEPKQPSLDTFVEGREVLRRENVWTLKVVKSHYSFHSCEDFVSTLNLMFPGFAPIASLRLGEAKCHYLAVFGLAPHFEALLKESIRKSGFFILMFDETTNKDLQAKQLDVHIRFWNGNKISSRYLTSSFLGHATASDLLGELLPICEDLGMSKVLQLSMNGPNVNWSLFKKLGDRVMEDNDHQLLNIGSCGLHVLHNAFQDGAEATKWSINNFLKSIYYLFHEATARREDYTTVTGSGVFALKFCKHRWIENVPVAERAIEMLDNLKTYVKAVEKKKFTTPTCMSFSTVRTMLLDPLLTVKLHIFLLVAHTVRPFLVKYQTDAPMLPFLARDLLSLVKDLLGRVVHPTHMDKISSPCHIHSLNLEGDIYLESPKFDVGVLARRLMTTKEASDRQKLSVRMEMKQFILATVKKIMKKSPHQVSADDC